jgi:Raf kinase inhibitor-like YbhB/YbcL family protein
MLLTSTSIENDKPIPGHCAFGVPANDAPMQLGENQNPQLAWSGVPKDAKSLVLLCIDIDVPSVADDVNKEGTTIPHDLPRVDFGHWGLVDMPAGDGRLAEGECSRGVVVGGKKNPPGPPGTRQALNDYTGFLAGNPDMSGEYFGYDGPCPPWNDERLHHYHFILYALDVERCDVSGKFTVGDIVEAIQGHVLDEARIVGTYTLNSNVSG